ncbi:MAG: septum formation initiator family protein [Bacteroidales bacterium]|jgi:cell division protein FtsB|nr:septum formation initiator family protein [Bacteroidales bacterium]MCK9448322.1 septum formation initiator family protein [Bacteroidales bacterium]MDD3701675.1 septum formation initiator family protein [Bacteroidales bacterium]MDY0369928.1 septum formation initiator family protein [Bacteroidales bacterium]
MIKRIFKHIYRFKYLYTLLIFIVWLIFFDQNSLINQHKLRKTLRNLEQQQRYYQLEIYKNREMVKSLTTDTAFMEQYAREKYLFKKDNEVIYLMVEDE